MEEDDQRALLFHLNIGFYEALQWLRLLDVVSQQKIVIRGLHTSSGMFDPRDDLLTWQPAPLPASPDGNTPFAFAEANELSFGKLLAFLFISISTHNCNIPYLSIL